MCHYIASHNKNENKSHVSHMLLSHVSHMLLSHENKFTVSLNNLFIDILNELNKTHNKTPPSTVYLVYYYRIISTMIIKNNTAVLTRSFCIKLASLV